MIQIKIDSCLGYNITYEFPDNIEIEVEPRFNESMIFIIKIEKNVSCEIFSGKIRSIHFFYRNNDLEQQYRIYHKNHIMTLSDMIWYNPFWSENKK